MNKIVTAPIVSNIAIWENSGAEGEEAGEASGAKVDVVVWVGIVDEVED